MVKIYTYTPTSKPSWLVLPVKYIGYALRTKLVMTYNGLNEVKKPLNMCFFKRFLYDNMILVLNIRKRSFFMMQLFF